MLFTGFIETVASLLGLKDIASNANGRYGVAIAHRLDVDIYKWQRIFVLEGKFGIPLQKSNTVAPLLTKILQLNLKQAKGGSDEGLSLESQSKRLVLRKSLKQDSITQSNAGATWKQFLTKLDALDNFVRHELNVEKK